MLRKPNVARHRTWPQQALPVLNAQGARRAVASLCGQPVPTEPSCRLGSSHNRDRAEARFGALRTGCAVRQSNNLTRQNNNSTGIFEEIGPMSLDGIFQTARAAEQLERMKNWKTGFRVRCAPPAQITLSHFNLFFVSMFAARGDAAPRSRSFA